MNATEHEPFAPISNFREPSPRDLERPTIARPMVFAALAYLAGVVVGRMATIPPLFLLAPAAGAALWTGIGLYRFRAHPVYTPHSGFLLLVALGLLGWAASNRALREDARAEALAQSFADYKLVRAEGRIAELPIRDEDSLRLVLDGVSLAAAPAGERPVSFPLKLTAGVYDDALKDGALEPEKELRLGDRIAAWGRLRLPRGETHPGDFDEVRYLHGRGIGARLNVNALANLERIPGESSWMTGVFAPIQDFRAKLVANLDRRLGTGEAAMAAALFLGERWKLDPEDYRQFQRTGMAHIVSVSGLHTGFILLLALGIARLSGLPPRVWTAVALVVLVGYAALTGFRPPVVRASIMGAFLMIGWSLGRATSILSGLAAAAFLTLALDPRNVIRVDWQLSYACVLAITLLAPAIYDLFRPDEEPSGDFMDWRSQVRMWARRYFLLPLSVVLAIQMGLLPLQVELSGQFNLVVFLAQLIMIPLAMLIVVGAALTALLGWLAPVGILLGWALSCFVASFDFFADLFASSAWTQLSIPSMPPWLLAGYYGVLLIGPHLRGDPLRAVAPDRRRRFHVLLRIGAFALALAWLPVLGRAAQSGSAMEVYMLDVGQGDAFVIRFPDRRIGVIDGGRSVFGNRGERTVAPFLRSIGAERIDIMMATQADNDHAGGLIYLVEHFPVRLFVCGPGDADTATWRELMSKVRERNIPMRRVREGDAIRGVSGVEMKILNSGRPGDSENDASLALLVDYREVELLFAADIEKKAERRLSESPWAQDVEVLKVAHHGSRTSSIAPFLDAFTPEYALISAGASNRYGHPALEVLERLRERDMIVLRTDKLGTVRLRTDGRHLAGFHYSQ